MSDVSEILSELGDHGFSDTSTTRKVGVINDTIWEICARSPWPFLEKTVDLTFNGISAVPTNVPSDLRAILGLAMKTDGRMLSYYRIEEVDKLFGTSGVDTTGTVFGWYQQAGVPTFVQIPNTSDSIRMRYIMIPPKITDTTLEAGIIIPPRHHRVITLGSLYKLYDMEDDPDLSARFETHYENRIQMMTDDLWHQQYDQPEYIVISDPEFDSYDY